MPTQNLRGAWRSVDVHVHFGIRNTVLGIQELEDDDEQEQETGGGPLKHGAGEAEEKSQPYRHSQKNTMYRLSFPVGEKNPAMPL